MQESIKEVLVTLGYDVEDPNFKGTPERVTRMLSEFKKPTEEEIKSLFKSKFPTNYKGMVVQKKIVTNGLCPHHLKDVSYKISFGIIYEKEALGLSKFTRIFKRLSRQLILQEELTFQIAKIIQKELNPKGLAIRVEGVHGCMEHRGVEQAIPTITTILTGPFLKKPETREEFFAELSL